MHDILMLMYDPRHVFDTSLLLMLIVGILQPHHPKSQRHFLIEPHNILFGDVSPDIDFVEEVEGEKHGDMAHDQQLQEVQMELRFEVDDSKYEADDRRKQQVGGDQLDEAAR
jgi:hypothetical protein